MKKFTRLAVSAALVLVLCALGIAQAEILPPSGEGQIGLTAVVLCKALSVRESASTSSRRVTTLDYRDIVSVTDLENGWAHCVLGDSEDALDGWVNADYLVIDPAWYVTDRVTPVYAWNSTAAPKVALLDANTYPWEMDTYLPILKEEGDWLCVSLRGASGWIHK